MDKDFCELFFGVMKEHLNDFISDKNIKRVKRVFPEIRKKYKCDKMKRETVVRSFPSSRSVYGESVMENIALFYECSLCLASATATNFSGLLEQNSEFFHKKMQRKTVNICCIAGGIASEMVAVVKILCDKMKGRMQEFLHFHLAFINADDKWNTVITSVLRELKADVMQKYKIKLTSGFVAEQNQQEVVEVFQSADILISTKFSQEMSNMKEKPFKQLLEVALQYMKSNSLFFFIDVSAADVITFLAKSISKFNCFQTLYKKDCVYHSLSLDSVELHLNRYSDYFGVDLSSSYCLISARAWLKFEKRRGSKAEDMYASCASLNQIKKDKKAYASCASLNQNKNDKKAARKDAYWFRRSVDIIFSHKNK